MSRSDGYQEPRRTVPNESSRSISSFVGYNADEDDSNHDDYSYYDCEEGEEEEQTEEQPGLNAPFETRSGYHIPDNHKFSINKRPRNELKIIT